MIEIVGGSGFIGTRLVARLKKSADREFRVLDKNMPSKLNGNVLSTLVDVRDKAALSAAISGDTIINLAAEHRDDVSPKNLYYDVNVAGAENICEAARVNNVTRIIFTSSVAVYGFAPIGTAEDGDIAPFNDYGKTKYLAEKVFKEWQAEEPEVRTLAIVRPTVVFGERNRGNVYNLLKQIASGRFVMVGNGKNRKSMAYVENIAAFLEYCLDLKNGVHIFNYIDKPDYDMNTLVTLCKSKMGASGGIPIRLPYFAGFFAGKIFDVVARITGKKFSISSIRVKKFCSDSVYNTAVDNTSFVRPVSIDDALKNTLQYEFIENHSSDDVFYSE